jgi:hypothetical protein
MHRSIPNIYPIEDNMKKHLLVLVCLILALPAAAMPASNSALIRALITDGTALTALIDEVVASEGESSFSSALDSIKVERTQLTPELRTLCKNNSRSGAALKVTINVKGEARTYLFSTAGAPENLSRCR